MKQDADIREVFPAALLLDNKACLVVGGGKVAFRKVNLLLAARAEVAVVAPEAVDELVELAEQKTISFEKRQFEEADLDDKAVVFAATNDKKVNKNVVLIS